METAYADFLAEFISESDAIEGIRNNLEQLRSDIVRKRKTGHVGALLALIEFARNGVILDDTMICRAQSLIVSEQHEKPGGPFLSKEYRGVYRRVNVSISGRVCMPPAHVSLAIQDLVQKVQAWQRNSNLRAVLDTIHLIADFHFDFERIHPFVDGNGRTGRALVFYLFHFIGFKPFIFTSADRYATYYRCFDDRIRMREYFCRKKGITNLP
ncbi:MAG: Fic family protein [bacterium]|nr:Fic family protein [bacterium]